MHSPCHSVELVLTEIQDSGQKVWSDVSRETGPLMFGLCVSSSGEGPFLLSTATLADAFLDKLFDVPGGPGRSIRARGQALRRGEVVLFPCWKKNLVTELGERGYEICNLGEQTEFCVDDEEERFLVPVRCDVSAAGENATSNVGMRRCGG